jgi:hypothetical protein
MLLKLTQESFLNKDEEPLIESPLNSLTQRTKNDYYVAFDYNIILFLYLPISSK